jgi:hypothetical protein
MSPLATTLLVLATLAASARGQAYDYNEVLQKSLLFYEAQRSGRLPANNRIDWRGDSATGDQITGGYYDAGDHVKFGFPMAAMTTQLAWGAITFQDGYEAAGQLTYMKECLQWATDYFIAAHTAPNTLYGQLGDGDADHAFWGRPEDMTMNRPAFKIDQNGPGSDLAGETAAALAAASIFYDNIGEGALAAEALTHARQLFDFADQYRGVYTATIPAGNFYNSWSGFNDELGWAAAWLAKATGEATYLQKAEAFYTQFSLGDRPSEFGWDNKFAGVQVLMYELTGDAKYSNDVNTFVNYILNQAPYTPKGMIYIDMWGSARHAGNLAHYCAQVAATGLHVADCNAFTQKQINYILGDGGRSLVVGFGNNPPQRPHHRGSSCPDMPAPCSWDAFNSPNPNPQTLSGALVGGPNQQDQYTDDRADFQSNEVATDYNAGFQSAVASLAAKFAK